MSDDRRDTFIDMAENLGLEPGNAEDMVDEYLEAIADGSASVKVPPSRRRIGDGDSPRALRHPPTERVPK